MLKIIKYPIFFFLVIFVASCYKDLGNYQYNEINQVEIKADSSTITVLQQDTLRVNIDLSQTMSNATDLAYQWVFYPADAQTRRVLDSTQNLEAFIYEAPGTYYLDYFVTDKITGVSFQKKFTVNVVSAFGEGWIVLEETNGSMDLGLITLGDNVFKNIYSGTNRGQKLPAGSFDVSVLNPYRGDQEIYILSPDDMIQVNYIDFLKINDFSSQFYTAPVPKPDVIYMETADKRFLNKGQVYTINIMTPGPFFFGLPLSGIGEYYMEPYEIYSVKNGFFYYDRLSQNFYKAAGSSITLSSFPQYDPQKDAFDMNHIGKQMVYAEKNVTYLHNALFKNNTDDSLFVYSIDAGSDHPAVAKYDVTNVEGLLNADHFKMSKTLNFLYYSTGNKVYKLDIYAQSSTLLYTFPAGTDVADIEMYYNRKNPSDPDNNQLLAIATNNAGEGNVYFFPLASTGNFQGDTYRKVYSGFNKINAITFKNRK